MEKGWTPTWYTSVSTWVYNVHPNTSAGTFINVRIRAQTHSYNIVSGKRPSRVNRTVILYRCWNFSLRHLGDEKYGPSRALLYAPDSKCVGCIYVYNMRMHRQCLDALLTFNSYVFIPYNLWRLPINPWFTFITHTFQYDDWSRRGIISSWFCIWPYIRLYIIGYELRSLRWFNESPGATCAVLIVPLNVVYDGRVFTRPPVVVLYEHYNCRNSSINWEKKHTHTPGTRVCRSVNVYRMCHTIDTTTHHLKGSVES